MHEVTRSLSPFTRRLAEHASALDPAHLPAEVVERARQVVLDTCAALLSAAELDVGRAILAFAATLGDRPEATVAASTLRLSAMDAALVNGSLAHADETDDSHFSSLTHPAAMAVPAALALGEPRGLDGATLLAAVVAGYDVQCRVAKSMGPRNLQDRGFMALAVCGSFGAAAAAGRALGLDAQRMAWTLGLVGLQTGGLWACAEEPGHYAKAVQSGFPARDGVCAALMAASGLPGPEAIFEGPNNAVAAFSARPDYEQLTAQLGQRYEIMGTSIKKHACGGPIRGPVDGLLDLMSQHRLAADAIARMDVRLAHSAVKIVGGRAIPSISLPFVMAVAAHDGFVGVEQTHAPRRTEDPQVLALADRVHLSGDDELEAGWPTLRPAVVELTLHDGRRLRTRVDHAAGSPERPLARAEVEEKFLRLSSPVIGEARARELAALAWRLASVVDVRELTRYLQV
ncbi:MAG: MmgE/PrpD family protein [Chloroflexi bacterium]|nr:MmgE/PrpD family protein [Chloroflexota bacterium]